MENAIELKGVHKTFGPKVAVRDLDLCIPTGSLCGFIGPNGAGKTTTIRMIMSIIFPDRGELSVLGKASAVESKDRIGYLPEERGIYRKMKVGAFLNYMGRLKGADAAGLDRKVRQWLERVGLTEVYRKKNEELSKGMQQKVQFVASVLHEPELIILDEPFSGLDPVNRRLLRELIEEQSAQGRTLIFSTHAMFEAEQLCDRLFMIHKGVKVIDASIADVWAQHDPRTVLVETLAPSTDADAAALGGIPGVDSVSREDGVMELHMAEGSSPGRVVAEAAQRIVARRIELKRPSLEDIFIQLVGGDRAALEPEDEVKSPVVAGGRSAAHV